MTICNTCLLNLRDVQQRLASDPQAMDEINAILGEEGLQYRGKVRVTHLLWVLLDDVGPERLRELVVRPLRGLKVAAFYGCHIVRPKEVLGMEDSRDPRSLEQLNEILGCASIDYSGRTACCGFHTAAAEEAVAIRLTGRHVNSAKQAGASVLVTPCPLCHTVLDTFQPEMEADVRASLAVPVLHLSQLVGLAMGMSPKDLGVDRHVVPVQLPL
jgi:succinate dehydrogenase / fumarate reductase cytochrome b subunit